MIFFKNLKVHSQKFLRFLKLKIFLAIFAKYKKFINATLKCRVFRVPPHIHTTTQVCIGSIGNKHSLAQLCTQRGMVPSLLSLVVVPLVQSRRGMNPGVTLLALPLTSVSVSQKAQHVLLTKTKKTISEFQEIKSFKASRGAIMANSPTVRKI